VGNLLRVVLVVVLVTNQRAVVLAQLVKVTLVVMVRTTVSLNSTVVEVVALVPQVLTEALGLQVALVLRG
jgi:hypothetical protein